MVGLRWVGCWVLLALSCGRTANSNGNVASGGSPNATGGADSGGASSGGSGPVSMQAGEAGKAGAAGPALCPVTPAAGQWFARGPDPYGFELTSDGVQLSGTGCLGALPSQGDALTCSPLSMLADRGRRVDFVWNASDALGFGAYVVKMALTVSPDRTAMAGTMWGSAGGVVDEKGRDIVLVREPADQPVPPATLCSQGVPSGACFLDPLRSDFVDQPRVVELGAGNLLLVWLNLRGIGRRIASARFDAATAAWQKAEFLDDGSAPVDPSSVRLTATPAGRAMVVYLQDNAITARRYDRDSNAWLEPQVLANSDPSANQRPVDLFVYGGGDATLVVSAEGPGPLSLSAYDYASSTGAWGKPQLIDAAAELVPYQWAAASDDAGNAVAVTVHGAVIGAPNELWFSRRSSAGIWSAPTAFHSVAGQLFSPAVAVGKERIAVATWQEFALGIASSAYSFEAATWGEPLTVTSQINTDNRAIAFDDTGTPVAYFHCNECASDADKQSTFGEGMWSAPQTATAADARGDTHAVTRVSNDIEVARLKPRAGESRLPPLERPRCDGY
jgi:hypothetical protein